MDIVYYNSKYSFMCQKGVIKWQRISAAIVVKLVIVQPLLEPLVYQTGILMHGAL